MCSIPFQTHSQIYARYLMSGASNIALRLPWTESLLCSSLFSRMMRCSVWLVNDGVVSFEIGHRSFVSSQFIISIRRHHFNDSPTATSASTAATARTPRKSIPTSADDWSLPTTRPRSRASSSIARQVLFLCHSSSPPLLFSNLICRRHNRWSWAWNGFSQHLPF